MTDENLICSFCNKSRKDVTKMIVGSSKTSSCNECVKLCVEILEEDIIKSRKEKLISGDKDILNPVLIKEHLDQYVIGQDQAKTVLSVAVSNHYKRITNPPIVFDLDKSNVIVLGATGAGKTLMARAIAQECDVNFIVVNGPEIVRKFYGESEALLRDTFQNAAENQPSILFIDEIDAIAPKRDRVHGEVEKRTTLGLC